VQLTSGAAQALEVQAIATSAGDVLAAYVSARPDNPAGPLQAVRIRPDGSGAAQLTLSAPGERVRDVSLATDGGAAYAAWTTAGTARRSIRVVRISGAIVGTRRTVSGSDAAAAGPPAFAMTLRGRALIAYATKSARIRLVTRAAN
jgi:hypothetical protein